MDTPRDVPFDGLTRMAAIVIGAPLAFATIVDDTRSFWKSTFGVPEDGPRQNRVEESFCQYVIRSGDALVVGDTARDPLVRDNPAVTGMGVAAWAGFPLRAPDGEVLGSFCVVDTKPRDWTTHEVDVLRTLSDAAAREIAHWATLRDEQHARGRAENLARTLQESLMPPALPVANGLSFGSAFHAAGRGDELGGDFFDVFPAGAGRWNFVIGDVCGKGIAAAKIASFVRYATWSAFRQTFSPSAALELMNEALTTRDPAGDRFVTALLGSVEEGGSSVDIRLASAGHVPPLVRRRGGETEPVELEGDVLGTWAQVRCTERTISLRFGDALVMVTDGVTEARRAGSMFDEERLRQVVSREGRGAAALARVICDAALEYGGDEPYDDIAVLVVESTAATD